MLSGIHEGLKKDGEFTFKGFFGGAWAGFKRGLDDVFGRGLDSLIPVYGRYCGPGIGNGGDNGTPLGGVDGGGRITIKHISVVTDRPDFRLRFAMAYE